MKQRWCNRIQVSIYGLLVCLILAWVVATYFFNPSTNAWAPKCVFKAATGLQCPGCGLQRAVYALFHGRFFEAVSYNWFLFLLLPYVVALVLSEFVLKGQARQRLQHFTHHRYVLYTYIVLYLLWGVVRNVWGL